MTNEEAIKRIKDHIKIHRLSEQRAIHITESLDMAIKALEKQISQKPLIRYESFGTSPNETFKINGCPCCKEDLDEETGYCVNCGQKIDWT